ncbi:MAG TPA: ABC transporter permease [Casimicrobiaceae bacterium]|nr:ABC transporter permease [Polyangiales bacterium]HTI47557.1 ABC transporter permease [Casimicrobiaceae bacterium]
MTRFSDWFAWLVLLFLAAPLAIVVPMSFSNAPSFQFPPPAWGVQYYRAFFADPRWLQPTVNSFIIGAATAVVTMALGIPAAFAIVRHRFAGRGWVNLLLLLPLTAPHIVLALGYYTYFGRLRLTQTYLGVVLAHTCLCVPIVYLTLSAALKGFDRNVERAAMNLGANPWRVFRHVTFPMLRPAFLVAALFAFIQSFDETVVALFISGRDASTLPRKIFDSLRTQADPVVAVVSTLLLGIVLAGTIASRLAARRRRVETPA